MLLSHATNQSINQLSRRLSPEPSIKPGRQSRMRYTWTRTQDAPAAAAKAGQAA
jgi:hypothetical protein